MVLPSPLSEKVVFMNPIAALRRVGPELLLLLFCISLPLQAVGESRGDNMPSLTDFDHLERPDSPNHWLIGPADSFAALNPDQPSAVFSVPAARLAAAWLETASEQPRVSIVARSDDRLQIEAEQRSRVFGFVDRVSFRAIALDSTTSTFIAYSRSQLGYWDLGVNRRRLEDWLTLLQQRISVIAEGEVAGTVTYRQRIAIPATAVVTVRLVDVSRADAAASVLGEQVIPADGRQVPFSFAIPFRLAEVDTRNSYAVQARIENDGTLLFVSDRHYPVITRGAGTQVDMVLQAVGRAGDR
jgi:putative lipoprotein